MRDYTLIAPFTTPLRMSGIVLRRSARVVASAPSANGTPAGPSQRASKRPAEGNLSDLDYEESSPRPTKRAKPTRSGLPKQVAPQDTLPVGPSEREPKKKPTRRKKEPPSEPIQEDFMARASRSWKVGPHVSAAGGVENAIVNAASVG